MLAPARLTIDDKVYMSTSAAAEVWGVAPKTVAKYCRDGKIKNKFKHERFGWYIRTDEIKPFDQSEIHKILVMTQHLKNNPMLEIDWDEFEYNDLVLEKIYQHLFARGYIQPFSIAEKRKIPYEVVLTQNGSEAAASLKKEKKFDFSEIASRWLPIIIGAAQLYFQINPIT